MGSNNEIHCFTAMDSCVVLYNPRLTGAGFASTSEVRTSAILKWLKLRD
jgi:hypothetical protein